MRQARGTRAKGRAETNLHPVIRRRASQRSSRHGRTHLTEVVRRGARAVGSSLDLAGEALDLSPACFNVTLKPLGGRALRVKLQLRSR